MFFFILIYALVDVVLWIPAELFVHDSLFYQLFLPQDPALCKSKGLDNDLCAPHPERYKFMLAHVILQAMGFFFAVVMCIMTFLLTTFCTEEGKIIKHLVIYLIVNHCLVFLLGLYDFIPAGFGPGGKIRQ